MCTPRLTPRENNQRTVCATDLNSSGSSVYERIKEDAECGLGPRERKLLPSVTQYRDPMLRVVTHAAGRSCESCFKDIRWPVLEPDSKFFTLWDVIMVFLLSWTAWSAPFETAFLEPRLDWLFVIGRIADTVFLVDMVLQLFTAYVDPARPTRVVRAPTSIVKNYLSGWFCIDMISIMPIDSYRVMSQQGAESSIPDFKCLRLLRLIRLLRLSRFSAFIQRWHTSFGFSYATMSLGKLFLIGVMTSHWIACIWGGLAVHGEDTGYTWLEALREAKGGNPERYEGPMRMYLLSLYWAIITVTSIGYGDITPQSDVEYVVATLGTAVMAAIWAYLIGSMCGIVSTMEPHDVNFKRTMDDLNWLMHDQKIPHTLCIRLRRYFHETREATRRQAEGQIMVQMSPQLQGEFAHFTHKKWITKVWYLATMPDEVIVLMSKMLRTSVFSPQEDVVRDRTLFIVQRGLAVHGGKILISGDTWGEDLLLSNKVLRSRNYARSLSYLTVLELRIEDIVEMLRTYPETRAKLKWAQVQIAILRGVQKIAEVTRDLEKKGNLKQDRLSEQERLDFFVDILKGKYSNDVEDDDEPDYLGVGEGAKPPLPPRGRMLPNFSKSLSKSKPEVFDELGSRVENISKEVANLTAMVQKLAYLHQSEHHRPNVSADFGPMVLPASVGMKTKFKSKAANTAAKPALLRNNRPN